MASEVIFILFQMLIWGILAVIIVYLIIRRISERDKEDFEKRDY